MQHLAAAHVVTLNGRCEPTKGQGVNRSKAGAVTGVTSKHWSAAILTRQVYGFTSGTKMA